MSSRVRTRKLPGFPEDVRNGLRNTMMRAADWGFRVSIEQVPSGATNNLRASAVEPQWKGGSIWWGYTAPHAVFVEKDTVPHWIPERAMPGLRLWARRVLGDEGAAGGVRARIAEVGTEGQEFTLDGVRAMREYINQHGLKEAVVVERRRRGGS